MKKLIFVMMLSVVVPVELCGQVPDTIYCRSRNYYYGSSDGWYDSCYFFNHPSMSTDTNDVFFIAAHSYRYTLTKHHTDYPLNIQGLSCMIKKYPDDCGSRRPDPCISTDKNPEYLHVCMFDSVQQEFVSIDSVRWDTAAPKILKLPRHADSSDGFCYCYVYEAMFPKTLALTVDGDFWIAGTAWNNMASNLDILGYYYTYTTHYASVALFRQYHWNTPDAFQEYCLSPKQMCYGSSLRMYNYSLECGYGSARGPFFPIIDSKLVEVHSSDSVFGSVGTSGYYPDSTYCDIYAHPVAAGRFLGWSDGSMDMDRQLFVTSDTVLTAYFEGRDTCYVRGVGSPNGHWGSVTGGGMYFDGDTVTLTAVPERGHRFTQWDDGDTANPRRVAVVSDTVLTAWFEELDTCRVAVWVNNDEWGHVRGKGLYYEGEEVHLVAVGKNGHRFLHWGDGSTSNMKTFTAEGDTLFEAYFDELSGIADVETGESLFALVPNPARGSVTVRTGGSVDCDGRCRMVMHDMSGREVKRAALWGRNTPVDIGDLKTGIYFVTVVTPQGVSTQKLAVE